MNTYTHICLFQLLDTMFPGLKWYTNNTWHFAVSLTNHFLPSEMNDMELLTVHSHSVGIFLLNLLHLYLMTTVLQLQPQKFMFNNRSQIKILVTLYKIIFQQN